MHRIFVLYLIATSLELIKFIIYQVLTLGGEPQPLEIIRIFTLKSGGVITAYVFLFILAPLALILLYFGKGITLLAISWIWYFLYVLFPESVAFPFGTFINISGLQVLFFSAMYVGFNNCKTLDYGKTVISVKWLISFSVSFLALIVFYIVLHPLPWMPQNIFSNETVEWLNTHLFIRDILRPGRLIAGLVVYGTFFIFLSLYWKKVNKIAGWLIMPFGISALYAYSVQTPIARTIKVMIDEGLIQSNFVINMLIQISFVLLIWFFTSKKNPSAF